QTPAFELPPLISTDVEKPVTDFVVPKPSVDRTFVPLRPAPAAVQAPREALATPPPSIAIPEPVAPKIERAPIAPVQRVAPLEPLPREQAVATPVLASLPPTIEPEVAKPVVKAPEPIAKDIVPPVVQPPAPVSVPAAPVAPAAVAAPVAEPKPRAVPAAPPAVAPQAQTTPAPRSETATPAKSERDVAPQVAPAAATKAAPAGPPPGSPSASRDLLKPRGDAAIAVPGVDAPTLAPGAAAGKAPALDLDAVRRRAREISRDGSGPRTVLPFPMTPPPKPKTKIEQAFDKALKKNDCREAYADMGLAAVVPLVIDSVREGGCKW
ncbi:MAG: hypothetical protein ABL931_12890, partial [Usitatibacteraceae bacterium]